MNATQGKASSSDPLLLALRALLTWLDSSRTPYVVIGGLAASIIGRPRMTQDIDWEYVLRWIGEFATALDAPEIKAIIERLRLRTRE